MSSKTDSDTPLSVFDSDMVHSGRCKWFNNKAGYGFLTVVRSSDDTMVGQDVFVHHTGIVVGTEQYRYMVQGEYVDFKMKETNGGEHKIQASDITGVGGGLLMCETRNENRKLQEQNRDEDGGERGERRPRGEPRGHGDRRTRGVGRRDNRRSGGNKGSVQVRLRGEGPREGEVWTLQRSEVKSNKSSRSAPEEEQ